MHDWGYIADEIEKIIDRYTTKPGLEDTRASTNAIIDAWLDGKSFDNIVKNDRQPEQDQEELIRAAAQLDLAIKSISKVGYLGTKALEDINAARNYQLPAEDEYREALLKSLRPISRQLKKAADKITSSDRGMIAILSGNEENPPVKLGRKQNHTALNISRMCATIFEARTDKQATVTHNPVDDTDTATGLFHRFLTEIFEFLEVEANPEHFIKKLRAEQKQK